MAKVLIKINDANDVIDITSDIFVEFTNDWISVDEGNGDRYVHAQGNYLTKGLTDELGRFNYKYLDGKIVELAESEKENRTQDDNDEPTIEERLDAIDSAIEELAELVGGDE